jgi:hypothetical protein
MTHRAHPMTRRPSRPPCPSSGGRSASCDLAAGGCDRDRRGHDLPPGGLARGSRRWAIRWAKPCRIGPYQAQRRARTGASIWSDLQVFRRVKGPRTPCFTRERTLVRNQPRPSERCSFAGTSSESPCGRATAETRCFVPHQSSRSLRTADERICRASSRLARERSPVRTQPRPSSSSDKVPRWVRARTWNAGARAWLPRLRGCRSDAGPDRAPADAGISSSLASVPTRLTRDDRCLGKQQRAGRSASSVRTAQLHG